MKNKILLGILIVFMIASLICIFTIGFNVGLKYSENMQISFKIEKEYNKNDIKDIAREVFNSNNIIIEDVEVYKDMVQITVKDASEDQINELVNKVNEKYEISNTRDDISVTKNANTRLRSLAEPYIIPIAGSAIVLIVYVGFRFNKNMLLKNIGLMIGGIIAPQAILFGLYAITRLPITGIAAIVSISLYVLSSILTFNKVYEKNIDNKVN